MKNNTTIDQEVIRIGTHDGVFHCDEVLAIALLDIYSSYIVNYDVIRTRDEKLLAECQWLIDVGGEYDGQRHFDHHQFEETDDDYGLSSAGLVLKYLQTDMNEINTEETGNTYAPLKKWIKDLIEEVDAHDCGIRKSNHPLVRLVSLLNSKDIYSESQEYQFWQAIGWTRDFLREKVSMEDLEVEISKIEKKKKEERREEINLLRKIKDMAIRPYAINKDGSKRLRTVIEQNFIFLPHFIQNWSEVIDGNSCCHKYIVFHNGKGGLNVQCIPNKSGSFEFPSENNLDNVIKQRKMQSEDCLKRMEQCTEHCEVWEEAMLDVYEHEYHLERIEFVHKNGFLLVIKEDNNQFDLKWLL